MSKQLGIHVLGPKLGEAVVVELPDNGVGVIDSFASGAHGRHPVIDFLRREYPALTELRFLAVTHPHADHCFRCADLYDELPPREVWLFKPFPLGQLHDYYKALRDLGTSDDVEAALGLPAGSVGLSLLQLDDRVVKRIVNRQLPYRPLICNQSFTLCGGTVKVHFLTPGNRQQIRYQNQVNTVLKSITEDGRTITDLASRGPDHNLASTGILIEYGRARAFLLADAVNDLWDEWFESSPVTTNWRPVQFIKAAHHGSVNGHHSRLYSEIADPKATIAVVTPFKQGNVHLPETLGIQALQPTVKEVYCTNRTSATASTSMTWNAVRQRPLPSIPHDWMKRIARAPTLGMLLDPRALASAPSGGRTPALPADWIGDATKNRDLWHLIRPEYRHPVPGLVPAHDYAVSAFLDKKGNVKEVRVGYEAGKLES